MLHRIKNFSVANNRLSGPVPMFYNIAFPAESYANNLGLCGAPLDPCMAAPAKFHVLFKQGFLVGWVFSMVSVVVVIFLYTPWVPLQNATIKNNKRMKEAIDGSQGSATTERSKNVKVEDVVSRAADGTSAVQDTDFASLRSQLGPLAAILLCIDIAATSARRPGFNMLKMRARGGMPVAFADFEEIEQANKTMEELQGSLLPSSDRGGMHIEYARSKMRKS
ncbi:hypothetical protein SO802_022381 [Lithocarpus litseifolius]|uniref:Uncharacterized protein n=1 Tax=Lithocarpus litseifolius TaxID=425828 RepID=A0AAW2CMD9_9ROSI